MEPLVSVIVLTYNQERYISQALNSVLSQKVCFDVEVLIGDDCSTDTTQEIVKVYADKHSDKIRLISSSENVGAVKNEKRLMEHAKGKYLAFLEGDDFWSDPCKLQKQVDFLEANPDYGLVHGDVDHFYENTGKTEHQVNKAGMVKVPEGDVFNELIKPEPYFIKTATTCFRRELAAHFDYDKAVSDKWPLTDLPLWLDITAHSKAHYFDEVFATYRLLNESASRTASPEKKLRYHQGLYRVKQWYMKKYACSEEAQVKITEYYYRGLLAIAYNLGNAVLAKESMAYLKQAHRKITAKEKLLYAGACYKPVRTLLKGFK